MKKGSLYTQMQIDLQLKTFGNATSKRFTKKTANDNRFYLRYKNKFRED